MSKANAGTKIKGADAGALADASAVKSSGEQDPGNDGMDGDIYAALGEELGPSDQDTDADDLSDELEESADDDGSDETEESDEDFEEEAENVDDELDEDDEADEAGESDEEEESEESDESDEEEESEEEAEDPELSKVSPGLRKRFRELTGDIKERDEKIASLTVANQAAQQQLEARVGEPEPVVTQITQISAPEKLQEYRQKVMDARAWALKHPNGGEAPDGKGSTREVSPEEVGETLAATEQMLMDEIPQRERFIQERAHINQVAAQRYPDLADPESKLAKQVAATEKHYAPLVRRFPEARMLILDAMVGQAQRTAAEKKPKGEAKPKPKVKRAPLLRTGGKRAGVNRDPKRNSKKARARLEQSNGSEADLAASLLADF